MNKNWTIVAVIISSAVILAAGFGIFTLNQRRVESEIKEKTLREEKLKSEKLEEEKRLAETKKLEEIKNSTKVGDFRAANHPTSGKVEISKQENGRFLLKITDLKTDAGPDLKILTSTGDEKSWKKDYNEIANLEQFSGNFEYDLGDNFDISSTKSVLIWCKEHDSLFGVADLSKK